jgi:hypothetical protein
MELKAKSMLRFGFFLKNFVHCFCLHFFKLNWNVKLITETIPQLANLRLLKNDCKVRKNNIFLQNSRKNNIFLQNSSQVILPNTEGISKWFTQSKTVSHLKKLGFKHKFSESLNDNYLYVATDKCSDELQLMVWTIVLGEIVKSGWWCSIQ